MYQKWLTGTALVVCAWTDIRERTLYSRTIGLYAVLAVIGLLAGKSTSIPELAISLIPGLFCLMISWISRQALGYGDSLLIAVIGISLGFWPCIWVSFSGFFWAGIWSGILLLGRTERKREIPFVPFLLAGFVIQCLGGVL
jgi:leader peptidase (prepilin peptidase)/N-methyltransferase